MTFEEIIIKQVLDEEGVFGHLELHQGDNVIQLSMGNSQIDLRKPLYKWSNLKKVIDNMAFPSLSKPTELEEPK